MILPVTNRDVLFYSSAQRAASLSDYKTRVGAILVRNGNVVAMAANYLVNSVGNVPLGSITIHAEEAAIAMASRTVRKGSTLYVARINRSGDSLDSRPCDRRCWPELVHSEIKSVVYFYKGKIVKERV